MNVLGAITIFLLGTAIGSFLNVLIDFVVIALVVYTGVKVLKLDKLDKKKA